MIDVLDLEVGDPVAIALFEGFPAHSGDIQIAQQSVVNPVSPAVDGHLLSALPRGLHNRRMSQIVHLFHHVQFTKGIQTALLWHFTEQRAVLKPENSGSEMVLVGLLRGSFMFMADLCREVQVPHEVDFMTASSYGSGMSTTRDVKILKDLDEDIRGKDVLIVEDIIDSGNTLSKVREILSLREPKSLAICTLLDKPSRREVNVPVEYVGFAIPDEFVVGYGIDYAQRYRHLPYIGKVTLLDE